MITYATQNPYEVKFGYVRALRRGPMIFVSGTTSVNTSPPFEILHPASAYLQTVAAFETSLLAIEALGGKRSDTCRVRMYVAKEEDCEQVGNALKMFFADHGVPVVATMLQGIGFVNPDMLVEVSLIVALQMLSSLFLT